MKHPVGRDRTFFVLCLVGLLLRATALIAPHDYMPPNDPATYMQLARNLAATGTLSADNAIYGDGLKALFPPVYPITLTGTGLIFGFNPLAATILNSLFDLGTAYLCYRSTGRNWIAPAIILLWPTLILSAPIPQKESLATFLVAALTLLFMRWLGSTREGAAFGLCAGLLTLTQPALLPFPALLGGMKIRRRAAVVAAICAGLVILPWTIRNWLIFGEFIPLTTAGGLSLAWVVNGGHMPPDMTLAEPDRAADAGKRAIQIIAAQPLQYLGVVTRHALSAFLFDGWAAQRYAFRVPAAILAVMTVLHLSLMIAAGIGLWFKRNREILLLVLAFCVTVAAMIWFEFGERQRYFLYPLLAIGTANLQSIRSGRERRAERSDEGLASGLADGPDPVFVAARQER